MKKALNLINWVNCSLLAELLTTPWEIVDGSRGKADEVYEEHSVGFNVIISFNPNKKALEKLNDPKIVLSPAAGVEWADKEYFQAKNITLVNQHANSVSVAEHAWGLILDQTHLISYNHLKLLEKKGGWTSPEIRSIPSIGLKGKNLAILGFGAIGKEIAKVGKAFEMNILAFKTSIPSEEEKNQADHFYLPDELETLLTEADILVVALPLTPKTTRLLNEENLTLLKKTAIITNISRAGVIEEEALFNILQSKSIRGYSSDPMFLYPFQQKEVDNPQLSNFPFHELENVTLSPHRAWTSDNAFLDVTTQIALNLDLIHHNKINELSVVDFDKGY
ncbi:MAG: NAD(P)-dependent oxidoreductase [Candidatus Kariarchaeaceae archaeon]